MGGNNWGMGSVRESEGRYLYNVEMKTGENKGEE